MAPLRNTRHEKFCQFLLQGETAIDAHEKAGFARSDANSSRLKANPKVAERLAELQNEVAGENKITVASLLDELEDARKRADSLDMLSAVVKAISEKAKIAGLMVQKVEVGGPGDFGACETIEAVADEMLKFRLPPYASITEQDRQGLIDLLNEQANTVEEYLAAIKAKPVNPEYAHKARRTELARHNGNGLRKY
jgi:phage terminase small subunit